MTLKEFGSNTRKALNRFSTKRRVVLGTSHEVREVTVMEPELWGSPSFQEKYPENTL
jgi:hypothetical protein